MHGSIILEIGERFDQSFNGLWVMGSVKDEVADFLDVERKFVFQKASTEALFFDREEVLEQIHGFDGEARVGDLVFGVAMNDEVFDFTILEMLAILLMMDEVMFGDDVIRGVSLFSHIKQNRFGGFAEFAS